MPINFNAIIRRLVIFTTAVLLAWSAGCSYCHAVNDKAPDRPKLPYKEFILTPYQIPSSHAASIVELPGGELFAVWYAPTTWSKNSVLWSSRKPAGADRWTEPVIANYTMGHSNKNPVLYLRQDKRLLLFWSDEKRWFKWVRDILRVKESVDFGRTWGPPRDVGVSVGFLPKNHPVKLSDGQLVLPLYTDWNTSAAVIISKDDGLTWSKPRYLLFLLGIQPTAIQRSDGSLFALMRTGTWPRLAWQAISRDFGYTWRGQKLSTVNNPGTALEMIKLRNGHVVLAFNNAKKDRASLSLALSCDEGRTWPYVRVIEFKPEAVNVYPSIMQDSRGLIHVLYSYDSRSTIAHFVTDEEWIK